MGLDITALRDMIWRPVGMDTDNDTELPRTRLDSYLNRSIWEIIDKFPFRETERTLRFNTVIGVSRYTIPESYMAVKFVGIKELTYNTYIPLAHITDNTYYSGFDDDTENYSQPLQYSLEHCFIKFLPVPDSVDYEIILKRDINITDLSSANTAPDLPQVWHEIIGYGGLWRAYVDFGDQDRANNIRALQASLINTLEPQKAKEQMANHETAGLEVLRRTY